MINLPFKSFIHSFLNKLSIKKKLIIIIMSISSMVLLSSLSIFITNELHSLKQTMLEDLSTLADLVGKNNTGAIMFYDTKAAEENLLALKAKPHIINAHLYRENGELFAHYHRNNSVHTEHVSVELNSFIINKKDGFQYTSDRIHMIKPIIFGDDHSLIGLIHIDSDRDIYWQRVKQYIYTITLMMAIALLLTLFIAFKAQKIFSDPILKLLTTMQKVSKDQNYSTLIDSRYDDEFGQLINGFNEMLVQLDQHQQLTKNYQKDLEQRVEERTIQLQKARDDALSASRTKSIFLANMSHEIRTPMNAILGYAQLLQQSDLKSDQLRQLNIIDKSGKHLLSLINSILELSKIEAGSLEACNSDFDLIDLVHNIENMFKIQCKQQKISWHMDCFSHTPVLVNGDQGKLRQVLINLIGNAFKFTQQGEILFQIKHIGEYRYEFSVSDTGVGINEQSLSSIFRAFHQEEQGQQAGGTGLGLNISKRYIELMSGNLQVESQINQGSRFFFDIELLPANDIVNLRETQNNQIYTLKSEKELSALVVDDIKDNSDLLTIILTQIGFSVVCAENGQEALDQIDIKCPDVVFMDIRMPVMDGIEAVEKLRLKYPSEQLKCIAVSASNMRHQSDFFIEKGYDLFIAKPFRFDDVYYAISKVLGIELQAQEPKRQTLTQTEDISEQSPAPATNHSGASKLNKEFIHKLMQAAEYGQLTELIRLKTHLSEYGPEGKTMASHLELLINTADMDGILEYVENVVNE